MEMKVTSINFSRRLRKVLEANGYTVCMGNLAIVPRTLGLLTAKFTYCIWLVLLQHVKSAKGHICM